MKAYLYKYLSRFKVWFDGYLLLGSTKQTTLNQEVLGEGLRMILAPHSDDEWIGCSSILKEGRSNVIVVSMDMEGGDTDSVRTIRYAEMQAVAERFRYNILKVDNDKVSWLKACIMAYKPKYIFVPCYIDWHDEHYEVMKILSEVLKELAISLNVVMYQVSLPMPPSKINYYREINKKDHKEKWRILNEYYRTQSYLPSYRFMFNERINGKMIGIYAAEVFSINTCEQWLELINRESLSVDERNYFRDHLNKIKVLHRDIYKL